MASEKELISQLLKGSGDNGRIVKKILKIINQVQLQFSKLLQFLQSVASAPAAQVAMNFVAGETTETVNSQVRNVLQKDFLKVNLQHLTTI